MSEGKDDSSNNGSDYPWIDHFEDFCSSDELSISEMRRMTDGIKFGGSMHLILPTPGMFKRQCYIGNSGVSDRLVSPGNLYQEGYTRPRS